MQQMLASAANTAADKANAASENATNAASAANTAADKANAASEKAEELYKTEQQLQDIYEKILDIKGTVGNVISGGSPHSIDAMCCDGGTPYTSEECEADAGIV